MGYEGSAPVRFVPERTSGKKYHAEYNSITEENDPCFSTLVQPTPGCPSPPPPGSGTGESGCCFGKGIHAAFSRCYGSFSRRHPYSGRDGGLFSSLYFEVDGYFART